MQMQSKFYGNITFESTHFIKYFVLFRKCLKEEIHKDVLVTGEYDVTEVPGQKVVFILSKFHFDHICFRLI